jgi:hypothetical protein
MKTLKKICSLFLVALVLFISAPRSIYHTCSNTFHVHVDDNEHKVNFEEVHDTCNICAFEFNLLFFFQGIQANIIQYSTLDSFVSTYNSFKSIFQSFFLLRGPPFEYIV